MVDPSVPTIEELQFFLDEIESLAPKVPSVAGSKVTYRLVEPDELIEDSLDAPEIFPSPGPIPPDGASPPPLSPASEFTLGTLGPIAAVDCGIARLGETENGIVIALRAAIVTVQDGTTTISLLRTGPIYLHNHFKRELLYQVGIHLGKPDHFVDTEPTPEDSTILRPVRVKAGVAHDSHKYADRFRNWFERLAQRTAATRIESGTVLIDGALTLRTIDTPDIYLENLAQLASAHGNSLIAVSKQSLLQVLGRPIRFWLNDSPDRPC